MMTIDEFEPEHQKKKPRDLTVMSVEGLEEYIQTLMAEIERAKQAIDVKQHARKGAESVFKQKKTDN